MKKMSSRSPYRIFMNMKITSKLIIIYVLSIFIPTITLSFVLYKSNYESIQNIYLANEKNNILEAKNTFLGELEQLAAAAIYFQGNRNVEFFLATPKNVADTIFYYLRDILPLIQSTKENRKIIQTTLYSFHDYPLNMNNGFSSLSHSDIDPVFVDRIKRSLEGVWVWDMENRSEPALIYYRLLYSGQYPYELGIVEIIVDSQVLFSTFSGQIGLPVFFNEDDSNTTVLVFREGDFETVSDISQQIASDSLSLFPFQIDEIGANLVIPIQAMPINNQNVLWPVLLTLYFLLFTTLYYFLSASFSRRLSGFNRHILSTDADHLTRFESPDYTDEVGHTIISYNHLIDRINHLVHENYKVQLLYKDAEFYALQAQIEPHFLYNILENIRVSANKSNDCGTERMIWILSDFMRYNLNSGKKSISLVNEMKAAKNYLEIHKIRMRDQLQFDVGAFTDIEDIYCPRFTLQPLLENAIKHGKRGDTCLNIFLVVHEEPNASNFVKVSVIDDGSGIEEENLAVLSQRLKENKIEANLHVGMPNVNSRLISFSGTEHTGLEVSNRPEGGTVVSFLLRKDFGACHEI